MVYCYCKLFKERSVIKMKNLQINNAELITTPNRLNF